MFADHLESWALAAVILEDGKDQILEIVGQILTADFLPVLVELLRVYQIVEVLISFGFLEREDALDNDEQDDAHAEDVNLATIIRLSFLDLGSHVRHGAAVRRQLGDLFEGRKAEVSDLEVEVLVDEDVLQLEVAVHDRLRLEVLERIKHLAEEVAAAVLAHAAQRLTQVEEQTARNVLELDVDEVLDLATRGLLNMAI